MDKRTKQLLERQAQWQRNRAALSWEEKLRMSLIMSKTQRPARERRSAARPFKETGKYAEEGIDKGRESARTTFAAAPANLPLTNQSFDSDRR